MTANTRAVWQYAAHTTDQITSPSRYKGAIQEACFLHTNTEEFSGEMSGKWASKQNKQQK